MASGNASGYNHASGRLDHQTYFKSIRVDQKQIRSVVLDYVLRMWLDEAILVSELLPLWLRTAAFRNLPHQWSWDGQQHVDPAKDASAQATRLASANSSRKMLIEKDKLLAELRKEAPFFVRQPT